jgi:hypothetical protein
MIREAGVRWLRNLIQVRSIGLKIDSTPGTQFFKLDAIHKECETLGLEVSNAPWWFDLWPKKFLRHCDAILHIQYTESQSNIGYKQTIGTGRDMNGWVTKEQIQSRSTQPTDNFQRAIDASVHFILENEEGKIFEGHAENKTYPESLPPSMTPADVHFRTMKEAEYLLLGSLGLVSPKPGKHSLRLLVTYGDYQKLALSALSRAENVGTVVADFLKTPSEVLLREFWSFWPEAIRDSRPEVRKQIRNLFHKEEVSAMLESGAIAIWGNYRLAELAKSNRKVYDEIRKLILCEDSKPSLRTCSILAINDDTTAAERLMMWAQWPDWHTQRMACSIIVLYGNESLLRSAASCPNPNVRYLIHLLPGIFCDIHDALFGTGVNIWTTTDPGALDFLLLLQGPITSLTWDRIGNYLLNGLYDSCADVRVAAISSLGKPGISCEATDLITSELKKLISREQEVKVKLAATKVLQSIDLLRKKP